MESQEIGQDNFQELLDMFEKEQPKKVKAAKRPNTLAFKKITKKSKKELQTAPFTEKVEKIKKPLLATPPVQDVEMIDHNLNSELGEEPLTPYQKHAAKFQKPSAKPEEMAPELIIPKGMLNTFNNLVLNLD